MCEFSAKRLKTEFSDVLLKNLIDSEYNLPLKVIYVREY